MRAPRMIRPRGSGSSGGRSNTWRTASAGIRSSESLQDVGESGWAHKFTGSPARTASRSRPIQISGSGDTCCTRTGSIKSSHSGHPIGASLWITHKVPVRSAFDRFRTAALEVESRRRTPGQCGPKTPLTEQAARKPRRGRLSSRWGRGPTAVWGYPRVSTVEQDPAPQITALCAAGVNEKRVVVDRASGSRRPAQARASARRGRGRRRRDRVASGSTPWQIVRRSRRAPGGLSGLDVVI